MTEQQQGQVPPNQARRTIKLKPLTKKVPKVMMTPEQLAQAQEAEALASQTAQKVPVMQTNIQEPKPVTISEPTVISPLTTQKTDASETVLLTSPSISAEMHVDDATRRVGKQAVQASPLPIMPSAKQTIKLRPTPVPLSTPAIPSAPKVPGAPTIKLTPTPAPSTSAPPVSENLEEEIFDDKTVAMSRPQRTAQPTSMPGSLIPTASASSLNLPPTVSASAPTLNLKQPSPAQTASSAGVVTSGSPTLKLKPKMPTVSLTGQAAASPPSLSVAQPKSPTIKLKINTSSITQSSPAAPSVPPPPAPPPAAPAHMEELTPTVPTLKLKPAGSQTLPPSASSAAVADMTKSKLQLKKSAPPPPVKEGEFAPAHAPTYSEQQAKEAAEAAAPAAAPEEAAAPVVSGREEPGMIFSIAAILTFCAISFMVYMVSWQYYLQWIKPGSPITMSAVTPKAAPKASAAAVPAKADKKDAPSADKKEQPAAAKPAEKAAAKPAEKPAEKAPAADKKPDAKK